MGKKLKITESQLKMLVENKNRKIVSEQPEQENINRDFELIYLVRGKYGKSILRNKRTHLYGLYSEKFKWMLQPDFDDTNVGIMGEGEDLKVITEFTNPNGKKFYTIFSVDTATDPGTPTVEVLNQKQYAELGHQFIEPDEEPSDDMRKRNNDKVYEESNIDEEELNGPSKEEYFTKHVDNEMNESIQKIKSQFKRFL